MTAQSSTPSEVEELAAFLEECAGDYTQFGKHTGFAAATLLRTLARQKEELRDLLVYQRTKLEAAESALAEAKRDAERLNDALEALTSRVEMCNRGVAEYVELVGLAQVARAALDAKPTQLGKE